METLIITLYSGTLLWVALFVYSARWWRRACDLYIAEEASDEKIMQQFSVHCYERKLYRQQRAIIVLTSILTLTLVIYAFI